MSRDAVSRTAELKDQEKVLSSRRDREREAGACKTQDAVYEKAQLRKELGSFFRREKLKPTPYRLPLVQDVGEPPLEELLFFNPPPFEPLLIPDPFFEPPLIPEPLFDPPLIELLPLECDP